jgi:hypothetical protein
MVPDRGLSNEKTAGVKGKKTRLTYTFFVNADGSDIRRPHIIGKAKKPRAFKKKTGEQLGFRYRNNSKAWMNAMLWEEEIHDWDEEIERRAEKISSCGAIILKVMLFRMT